MIGSASILLSILQLLFLVASAVQAQAQLAFDDGREQGQHPKAPNNNFTGKWLLWLAFTVLALRVWCSRNTIRLWLQKVKTTVLSLRKLKTVVGISRVHWKCVSLSTLLHLIR